MRIRHIFERVTDKLFAVSFEETDQIAFDVDQEDDPPESFTEVDELERAFTLWADVSWLWQFFNRFRSDLTKRDPGLSVKKAVRDTVHEAQDFHDELMRIVANGTEAELLGLFKPLHNKEAGKPSYQLQMFKVKRPRSWLRLYAIKYKDGYVVTGGAIKITDSMERPHLKYELFKLEFVQKFLQGEVREEDFVYLDLK